MNSPTVMFVNGENKNLISLSASESLFGVQCQIYLPPSYRRLPIVTPPKRLSNSCFVASSM